MKPFRRTLVAATAALIGVIALGHVLAQSYPTRPVSVVGPFASGGATDLLARVFTRVLEKTAGQLFVIGNRAVESRLSLQPLLPPICVPRSTRFTKRRGNAVVLQQTANAQE